MVMMLAFANRDDAPVGDFALHVLKLDGGVNHPEVVKDFLRRAGCAR
jgi:hypothetical protein